MKPVGRIHLLWTLALLMTQTFAQQVQQCPVTPALQKELNALRDSGDLLPVLIGGDVNVVVPFLKSKNMRIKFTAGSVISAELNAAVIKELCSLPVVSRIDCPKAKLHLLNDVMVIQNNADSAYYGNWPLEQGYDGSGVIIGVIDAPFDYDHPDFTDSLGNTRIQFLWDQTLTDSLPAPDDYGYGVECDSASIADGTCPHTDYNYWYSHGSGVAGVAASSGNAANAFRGVAPNADLILVALDFSQDYLSNVVDAVAYIFQKAEQLGKPCVINTSLGAYDGSHDGQDLVTQAIDTMIGAAPGRALVAAAGNGGDAKIHLGYDVSDTTRFTWFKKLSYTNAVYFQVFADTADFNDVFFSIGADDPAGWHFRGATPEYNVLSDYVLPDGAIDSTSYDLYDSLTFIGNIKTYIQSYGGVYFLEVVITPAFTTYYWRFSTRGAGRFDTWSTEGYTGFSDYVVTGLPSEADMPEIAQYRQPDLTQNIVGYWQCSDRVITVGSYVNRDTMTNYYGETITLPYTTGTLAQNSSIGPTRDNRTKPDITSTGSMVLTTGSTVLTNWLISLGAANNISPDGMHYLQNGTSFASPAVAGIAALYFQKYPDANWLDLKNALLENARQDSITGFALPDNAWGYGKANAFRTLTGSWGCEDDNYSVAPVNAVADITGATEVLLKWDCIPNAFGYQLKMKDLSTNSIRKRQVDTNAVTLHTLQPGTTYKYSVRAYCASYGFSEWSAPVFFTMPVLRNSSAEIQLFPNPAHSICTIGNLPPGELRLFLWDALGNCIFSTAETIDNPNFEFPVRDIPAGFYILVIQIDNRQFQKPVVINH